ncbi:MAG: hypothetical protein IPI87_16885 [Betaproteobacteria bacterium]|nr:hypothetical protein [Betaproteobacteria bacterium]
MASPFRTVAMVATQALAVIAPASIRAQALVRTITGSGGETLGFAQHVTVGPANGNAFVADTGHSWVLVFTSNGRQRALPAPIDALDPRAMALPSISCLVLGAGALRRRG